MTRRSPRAALAADARAGAGNVLSTVLALGADPSGPGLTFDSAVDGRPAGHPFPLGELDARVDARASALHAWGVRPRDPIAVWAASAADQILSFLALTRIGAIPALINGHLGVEVAAEYIRRLRAAGVLADAARVDRLAGHDVGAPILGTPAAAGTGDPAAAPVPYRHHPDDPIVITHSSGTTGLPKAVLHSHASLFAATRHLLTMPQAQGSRRILNALPAPHTATVLMVNQALGNRADLLALSTQDGLSVLEAIERWRPEGVFGFAVTWAELSRHDLSARDLSSVRIWFNTGDCAHEAHIRRLVPHGAQDRVGRRGVVTRAAGSAFIDGLGSSEMGHSIFHVTHRVDTDHYGRRIGRPYQFADVVVLSLSGDVLGPGKVGHLGVKSPTLFRGYWNDSLTTYRSMLAGYYLTGDLVYTDTQGRYYHVDRAADAVDIGGGTPVYTALSEERILLACPDVVDCTVVSVVADGVPVTDVLLLLAREADPVVDRAPRVRDALGSPAGATLRRVVAVREDDIPTGVTGKVRKLVLRQQYLAGATP